MGRSPFEVGFVFRSWASAFFFFAVGHVCEIDVAIVPGLDDCDFNLHLSNSSYAKVRFCCCFFFLRCC